MKAAIRHRVPSGAPGRGVLHPSRLPVRLPPGACRTFDGEEIPACPSAFPRKRQLSEVGLTRSLIPEKAVT